MFTFHKDKAYLVHWDDHWSDGDEWNGDNHQELKPLQIKSLGYCVAQSDEIVMIASHINVENKDASGAISIMKKAITEAWELTNL